MYRVCQNWACLYRDFWAHLFGAISGRLTRQIHEYWSSGGALGRVGKPLISSLQRAQEILQRSSIRESTAPNVRILLQSGIPQIGLNLSLVLTHPVLRAFPELKTETKNKIFTEPTPHTAILRDRKSETQIAKGICKRASFRLPPLQKNGCYHSQFLHV